MVQGTLSLLWVRGALLQGHGSGTRYPPMITLLVRGALLQVHLVAQGTLL